MVDEVINNRMVYLIFPRCGFLCLFGTGLFELQSAFRAAVTLFPVTVPHLRGSGKGYTVRLAVDEDLAGFYFRV